MPRNQRIADVLGLDGIQRLVVTRYSSSYVESPDKARRVLADLMASDTPEPVLAMLLWSEGTIWSIDVRIEFRDGKRGRLITDGWHGMFEDRDGYRWFFRARVER